MNLTGDTHPMHMHLVTFQVIGRTPFDVEAYEERQGEPRILHDDPGEVRAANRNDGATGLHIVEHENNDMMRPFTVTP